MLKSLKMALKGIISDAVSQAPNIKNKSVYIGDGRVLTKNAYGQKMILPSFDISLTPHILMDGYWEKWITNVFIDHIKPGMTVLDVGSNVGYYSLLAASIVGKKGKVIAFEANKYLCDIIYSNFSINGYLDFSQIKNVAVYSESTKLPFTILDKSVFGNSFINNETFQQYACHGYLSHGLRHIKASLVIPHKTPPANQPAECSFNYPTLRHWLKACLPWCAFHDFHNKSKIGGLVHQ